MLAPPSESVPALLLGNSPQGSNGLPYRSLTRILQFLEKENLVHRSSDSTDQRRFVFKLTAKGHNLFEEVAPDAEKLYFEIEQSFGTEKLQQLYALLADFSNNLSNDPKYTETQTGQPSRTGASGVPQPKPRYRPALVSAHPRPAKQGRRSALRAMAARTQAANVSVALTVHQFTRKATFA